MFQRNDPIAEKTAWRSSRRLLLRTALTALAGASLWQFIPVRNNQGAPLLAFTSRLIRTLGLHKLAALSTTQTLTHLGRFTEAELAESLTELLQLDIAREKHMLVWSEQKLREHLRANILNDYRTGRLVQFHGWWLSKTESVCFSLLSLQ